MLLLRIQMQPMPLATEEKLLIHCVSNFDTPADSELSKILENRIAWDRFLVLAERNEVVSLVYTSLNPFRARIPANVVKTIQLQCESIAAWNLCLAVELVSLWQLFQKNGIRAIPYKGPALAVGLYSQLSLRHCRDLDLFVDRNQISEAAQLMESRGYQKVSAPWARSEKDLVLQEPLTGIHVELHWAVCELEFDPELHRTTLWSRRNTVQLLDTPLPIPGPEEMLFLLAVHGMRHSWNCLKWSCDVRQLLKTYPELNWDAALHLADRFSRRRTLLLPLEVVQSVLRVSLPPATRLLVDNDPSLSILAKQISHHLFADNPDLLPAREDSLLSCREAAEADVVRKVFRLRSKDRLTQRFAFCLKLVWDFLQPDANDLNSRPVLSNIRILYWVIQPFRLARAHGVLFVFRTSRQLLAALMR